MKAFLDRLDGLKLNLDLIFRIAVIIVAVDSVLAFFALFYPFFAGLGSWWL